MTRFVLFACVLAFACKRDDSAGKTAAKPVASACAKAEVKGPLTWIEDDYPAGIVSISGGFAAAHGEEIEHLARNVEKREMADHALKRIMSIETEGGESDPTAPSSMNETLPGDQPPADGAVTAMPGAGEGFEPSSEDGWSNSDPFEFEDESVLREMGPGYSRFDGRDPFLALVTANNQGAASATVDPDGMRFVGIIWGERGIRALVEDSLRRGYVLREGDRVLYGRVTSISRDRIDIDQVIHGEFKRVTLRLEPYSREGN